MSLNLVKFVAVLDRESIINVKSMVAIINTFIKGSTYEVSFVIMLLTLTYFTLEALLIKVIDVCMLSCFITDA